MDLKDIKILVVDDEPNICKSIKMVLDYEKFNVLTSNDALSGYELFKSEEPDLLILDVKMPGMDGLTFLKGVKESCPMSEVIMISGHSGIQEAIEASKIGAFDFLEKPVGREKLIISVRNAAQKILLNKENLSLKSSSSKKFDMVGESKAINSLKELIKNVAPTSSTVLILGESGTGKELVARMLHNMSKRKNESFVQVNCAAIPEELIESELFGHEKGSFTGAIEKKEGKFEAAHKGTIFLDEVADLSLKAQAKVLRVLEESEIQRLGSSRVKRVDVRVIAASNKDLKEEISEGRFREDLFFRLNVIPLVTPTLRERKSDIELLLRHFIDYFAQESNIKAKEISEEAVKLLKLYDWPGNIRELRNTVERFLILSSGKIITPKDLPEEIKDNKKEPNNDFLNFDNWKDFKANSEKAFLEHKLKENSYNIAKTSREINMPRSNLYKKIELYDIIVEGEADRSSLPDKRGEESPDT